MGRKILSIAGISCLLVAGIWLVSCGRSPDNEWHYSRVYEAANPERQITTTLNGLDVLQRDAFARHPESGSSLRRSQ